MKSIYIALKDMLQSFRSAFALVFMFGVPILITFVFYFMFGGSVSEGSSFSLPATTVQIVNLDEGDYSAELIEILKSDNLQDLMQISSASSAEAARQAVDQQEVNVAIIIPANFSAAVTEPDVSAEIEIYQDPTLTIGPEIVRMIVNQLIEGYSGGKIVVGTAVKQWIQNGVTVDEAGIQELISSYIAEAAAMGESTPLVAVESPGGESQEQGDQLTSMLSLIMSGMMLFFAFFTAASTTMSILREDARGTLARLFSTPTSSNTILNGKFLATALVVLVQIFTLIIFGRLVFKIDWGNPALLIIVVLVSTANATGLSIFLNSIMKDEKQAGMIFGGFMTITGMLGMIEAFLQSASSDIIKLSYLVPQGWAFNALNMNMHGELNPTFWLLIAGNLVWATVLFIIGNLRFKRRFA